MSKEIRFKEYVELAMTIKEMYDKTTIILSIA